MRPASRTHVLVHLRTVEDATCVADALTDYAATIVLTDEGWDVNAAGSSLEDVMEALRACLVENVIPLARVTVDGRSYAMEGRAETRT